MAVVELKCTTRLTANEIGELIGRSPKYVSKVWRAEVRRAEEEMVNPEKRRELKAWMLRQVQMTVVKAQNLVESHAAYGALVLKGVEALERLAGVEVADASKKSTLDEIAEQVKVRSPLVLEKLEGVRTLKQAERLPEEYGGEGRKSGEDSRFDDEEGNHVLV